MPRPVAGHDQRDCRRPGALDVGDTVPQSEPGPVLLVPGYGGNVNSLEPVAARSVRRAARRWSSPRPETVPATCELRPHLGDVAERVVQDSGATSVDVVGYSAGGVVARLWVRDKGGVDLARRVLTLGSPHHGNTGRARRRVRGRLPARV